MDLNKYLNLLYTLNSDNYLEKKSSIFNFYKGNVILNKYIIKKKIKINKVIIPIKLKDKKILLIEDIALNFLLSYSILIGKKTQLYEFELNNEFIAKHFLNDETLKENTNNNKYIADDKIYKKLKINIITNSIKKIEAKKLFSKKYQFNFEEENIIKKIKEYSKNKNNLDLNSIHIIDSNKIELFLPTIKKSHFKLAENLNIPIINIIKKNYILDSTCNIYNEKAIFEKIFAKYSFIEEITWNYTNKINKLGKVELVKCYKDIKNELYLNIEKEKIIEKINEVKKVNFNLDLIREKILIKKNILFSWEKSNILIPLFKTIQNQKFVNIKNCNDFFEITGVKFKLNESYLNKIFIQNIHGEKAIFINKYLNPKLENCINTLNRSEKIEFENIDELIIKIIYNKNENIEELNKIEILDKNHIFEINKLLKYLIKIVILSSIKENKIPRKKLANSFIQHYYSSCIESVYKELNIYNNYPSKVNLIKNILNISNNLIQTLKNQKISFNEIYFILEFCISLIKVFEIINKELAKEIKKLIDIYFKNYDYKNNFIFKNDEKYIDIEKTINDLTLTNKLSLKKKTYILIKLKILKSLFQGDYTFLKINPSSKIIIKINKIRLKNIFPKSHLQILKVLKNINFQNITQNKKIEILIKKKIISLDSSFFYKYEIYNNYKTICDNKYFKVLINK